MINQEQQDKINSIMDWFDFSKRNVVSPVDQLIFDDLKNKNLID